LGYGEIVKVQGVRQYDLPGAGVERLLDMVENIENLHNISALMDIMREGSVQ
jgi:hypothetical protein